MRSTYGPWYAKGIGPWIQLRCIGPVGRTNCIHGGGVVLSVVEFLCRKLVLLSMCDESHLGCSEVEMNQDGTRASRKRSRNLESTTLAMSVVVEEKERKGKNVQVRCLFLENSKDFSGCQAEHGNCL